VATDSGIKRSADKLIFDNDIRQVYSIRYRGNDIGQAIRYLAKIPGIKKGPSG
jgi:hypothetical protein